MKIWKLLRNYDGFESYEPKTMEDFSVISQGFRGTSLKEAWVPVHMELFRKGKKSDFPPGMPLNALTFSRKAINILGDLLEGATESLPVIMPDNETYYAVNVLKVLDCIDKENVDIKRNISGEFYKFIKYAFKKEKILNAHIFKIINPEYKEIRLVESDVFVSDEFRNRIQNSELKGFLFDEVWDSEVCKLKVRKTPYFETDKIYTFDETSAILDMGKTVASDKWAMRLDQNGEVKIGELQPEGEYFWMDLMYYPPIFLGMEWRVVEIE